MAVYFVTTRNGLETRWQQAFPDAQLIAFGAGLPSVAAATEMVWLDVSQIEVSVWQSELSRWAQLGVKVAVLSPQLQDEQGLQAVKLGAVGYGHLMASPEQLREIALVIKHGGLWLGPSLLSRVVRVSTVIAQELPSRESAVELADCFQELTDREVSVAKEVAKGASNREIAEVLSVSERTVKAHLTNIFEKLELRDRVQLALMVHNISPTVSS